MLTIKLPHVLYRVSSLAAIAFVVLFYNDRQQGNELLLEDVDTKNTSFFRREKRNKTLPSSMSLRNASNPREHDLVNVISTTMEDVSGAGSLDEGNDIESKEATMVDDASPPTTSPTGVQPEITTPESAIEDSINGGIPSWSNFPRSQFTDHVLDNIQRLKLDSDQLCDDPIKFTVSTPHSIPNITCDPEGPWCEAIHMIFKDQTVPYNVSVGFFTGDNFDQATIDNGGCLGNSSPKGIMCMPNVWDLGQMVGRNQARGFPEYQRDYDVDHTPWEDRHSLPVFRGTGWVTESRAFEECVYETENLTYSTIMRDWSTRFKAVDFSVDNPDLLDARFSGFDREMEDHCLKHNATNGLNKFLPADWIDHTRYMEDYQVALALPGIGAPFRVSIHFMTRTAVMLVQDAEFEEWFTPYLEPFVHYIPLSRDLHDLEERLRWVKTHGEEVKTIAENSHEFYKKYLTFARHEEHIFELIHRLSEYTHYRETQQQSKVE